MNTTSQKHIELFYWGANKTIVCIVIFIFLIFVTNAQSTLLDSVTLSSQPVFSSIRQAIKEPEKVYRLSLDGLLADADLSANDELYRFKNLQELKISGKRFNNDTLPESITKLANLQILSLWHTPFKYLPASIKDLQNLEKIYVTGSLVALPKEIGELKKLHTLYISYSGILVLPETVKDLKNLKELAFYYTQITDITSSIGYLKNLQILNISGTKVTNLPKEISQLKNLSKLNIEDNHFLKSIPTEVTQLENLKELRIIENENVLQLPSDFSMLTSLERLEISSSSFNILPAMNGMKNLKYLKLFNNLNLSELPPSFTDLVSLQELIIKDCPIRSFPGNMKKLNILSGVTLQQMDSLNWESVMNSFSQCENLIKLNISENKLTNFPNNLSKLNKLESLTFIAGYNSSTIEQFNWDESIKTVVKLKNIRVLNLSGNKMKSISSSFSGFKKLDSLYLNGNNLLDLSKVVPFLSNVKLTYLGLSGCRMKKIPENIGKLVLCENLDISQNLFDTIPDAIGQLKKIIGLDLSSQGTFLIDGPASEMTCLRYISPSLYSLTGLLRLNLMKNPCLKETKQELKKKLPTDCILEYDY